MMIVLERKEFGWLHAGIDGEHAGVSSVKTCKIFAMQDTIFLVEGH